jgi:hypothetical protein
MDSECIGPPSDVSIIWQYFAKNFEKNLQLVYEVIKPLIDEHRQKKQK